MKPIALLLILGAVVPGLWAQTSIRTKGTVETDAQLKSNVRTGTPPLVVSSRTTVRNLDADMVDGLEGTELASMLLMLQNQVDSLGVARIPRTGQTTCYDEAGSVTACGSGIGLGQDGDLQLGVTWPNPRFTDNGDGTVADNLTGLTWLKDADCFGQQTWEDALSAANGLFDGSTNDPGGGDCGLSDGSTSGAWRLPNIRELMSLSTFAFCCPVVPNTAGTGQWTEGDPFSGVNLSGYWSSTSYGGLPDRAVFLSLNTGTTAITLVKTSTLYVWPVRGGQ